MVHRFVESEPEPQCQAGFCVLKEAGSDGECDTEQYREFCTLQLTDLQWELADQALQRGSALSYATPLDPDEAVKAVAEAASRLKTPIRACYNEDAQELTLIRKHSGVAQEIAQAKTAKTSAKGARKRE